jgi:predicted nucleotidyltransferase
MMMKKPLNKEKIFSLLKQNEIQLREFGVKQIGLFGSFVRQEQNDKSDVDFLVEFEPGEKNFRNFINLVYFLEDLLHKKVEIVTIEALSPYIGPSIIQEVEYAAEFKGKYPTVDWRAMGGMRDKLIHDYFGIDYDIVWDVIKNEIPKLVNELDKILQDERG